MINEKELIAMLRQHNVATVVIGGHAVNFHGFSRITEDLDLVWVRTPESEIAMLRALSELKAMYIGQEIDPGTKIEKIYPVTLPFIRSSHLMMLTTPLGFVDFFDYIPGFPEEDPMQLIQSGIVSNDVRYVSLVWLRKMKEKTGRSKDKWDLENLPV